MVDNPTTVAGKNISPELVLHRFFLSPLHVPSPTLFMMCMTCLYILTLTLAPLPAHGPPIPFLLFRF